MKIIELYKDILTTASLVADKDDNISASSRGVTIPFTVDGKRLVLPTREQLKNPDWSNRVVFHPLSENIMKPESLVIEKFRNAINTRLNMVIGFLMTELLGIVTSVEIHSKLSPDQADLLTKIKDTDSKTVDALNSVLGSIFKDGKDKRIIHLFLKRGGYVGPKRFSRATIVTFPLYKELKGKEKQVYGVTLRNKDKDALISLLEFIIPGIEEEGSFNTGSQSDLAPSLDSLMKTVMKIGGRTNIVATDYSQYMVDDAKEYLYSDSWVDVFDNLNQLEGEIRAIPMQAGNDGQLEQKVAPQVQPQAPVFQVAPVASQPVNTTGYISQVPMHNANYPVPQNQQPTTGPKGQVYTENGGLDFAATLRNNPALAGAAGGYPNMPWQQPQPPGPANLRSMGSNYNVPHGIESAFIQPQNQYPVNPNNGYNNSFQQTNQYVNNVGFGYNGFGNI